LASALESVATDADGLADWAGNVVPGVGGAAIDGLEEWDAEALAAVVADATADDISAVDSAEDSAEDAAEDAAEETPEDSAEDAAEETPDDESPDDAAEDVADESPDDELDDGAGGHAGVEAAGDSKETATMPSIDVEDLLTIGPDDETDLADDIDTDEPVSPSGSSPVIDENADKWDRMLGLDVVPDSAENVVLSDQVPQRSNLGLWIVLGLVLGGGVAWSLGLFGPVGLGTDAEVQEPPVVTPAADVVVPPPAEKEVVSPPVLETPEEPEQAPAPEAVQPVEVPEAVVPPVIEPEVETAPSDKPVPEPTPAPAPEAAPEIVPEAAEPQARQPVAPQTGLIRVAGDAHQVRLVNAGRRYSGGRMPPGAYHIEVVFQEGEKPRVAGRINLAAGDRKLVRCAAAFYRCQVH
jgi:hypothetical protein